MTGNQLQYWAQEETKRHNLAMEAETNRANIVNEGIAGRQATVAEKNAETNATNAETNKSNASSNLMQAQSALDKAAAALRDAETKAQGNVINAVGTGLGFLGSALGAALPSLIRYWTSNSNNNESKDEDDNDKSGGTPSGTIPSPVADGQMTEDDLAIANDAISEAKQDWFASTVWPAVAPVIGWALSTPKVKAEIVAGKIKGSQAYKGTVEAMTKVGIPLAVASALATAILVGVGAIA